MTLLLPTFGMTSWCQLLDSAQDGTTCSGDGLLEAGLRTRTLQSTWMRWRPGRTPSCPVFHSPMLTDLPANLLARGLEAYGEQSQNEAIVRLARCGSSITDE